MNKLALGLPTFSNIQNPAPNFTGKTLGEILTQFISLALYVAGFMMIFWFAWGVYEYILARGNKEGLAKARNRIWWALMGFIILISAVFISDYIRNVIFSREGPLNNKIKVVCPPTGPC